MNIEKLSIAAALIGVLLYFLGVLFQSRIVVLIGVFITLVCCLLNFAVSSIH